jgi:ATP-dependent phosphofructokinase / diphosphate-dependent phosphofructokinase
MKIGVLTGGGDAPGLNAVIRAIVKTATHRYRWEVVGIEEAFEGLISPDLQRPLTQQSVQDILTLGGTILGTTNRVNPFQYRRVVDGREEVVDMAETIKRTIASSGLEGVIVIGGDGTLTAAHRLWQMGCPMVGVPKTIDNDLLATDVTFGFQTAVATATEALDKLQTTAEAHHRVMVVEVMGRYAGWIALEAGIAGGADVILLPEIPFSIDAICRNIDERRRFGDHSSIVVVAEGATASGGGRAVVGTTPEGYERLGGIGNKVGDAIRQTGLDVRVTVLGHLQRGGSPTPFDRLLATRFGVAAVNLIAEGKLGQMVSLRSPHIVSVPLEDAIKGRKMVDPDGEMVRSAEAIGVSFGR